DVPPSRIRALAREESMSSLWGVEVHHLNCLSLHPWLGPGDARRGTALGPEGRVLSMCFSFDGGALAVGHEGALTVWSTEDGTRLVCTTAESRRGGGSNRGSDGGGGGHKVAGSTGGLSTNTDTDTDTSLSGEASQALSLSATTSSSARSQGQSRAASGTLDLLAGGARALSWESEGYRLISVGSAM
ncbi:unnamed protein product, partial [Laminaria digitata]